MVGLPIDLRCCIYCKMLCYIRFSLSPKEYPMLGIGLLLCFLSRLFTLHPCLGRIAVSIKLPLDKRKGASDRHWMIGCFKRTGVMIERSTSTGRPLVLPLTIVTHRIS